MDDVAPALNEAIMSSYYQRIKASAQLALAQKALADGRATHYQTQQVAQELGIAASDALLEVVTYGALPNDKLYWNITTRIIPPLFDASWAVIYKYGSQVQEALNRSVGLGLKAVSLEQDKTVLEGVMNEASNAEGLPAIRASLDQPVKIAIWHMAHDIMRANGTYITEALSG